MEKSAIQQFLEDVPRQIVTRGKKYYQDGKVTGLTRDGNRCRAQVAGSGGQSYTVEVDLTEQGQVDSVACECPYEFGDVCKHAVAVLLTIENGAPKARTPSRRKAPQQDDVTLETLVAQADRKALEALVLKQAVADDMFRNQAMVALGAPAKQQLALAKERLQLVIRRNTHRGYMDTRGCDAVCIVMDDIVDSANRLTAQGAPLSALTLAAFVFSKGYGLASWADSSSGSLGFSLDCAAEALQTATTALQSGTPEDRRAALDLLCKTAKSKAFDGWGSPRYDPLRCAARLADAKSCAKIEKVLDALLANAYQSGRDYSVRNAQEEDLIVRFYLRQTLEGPQAARAFLNDHLEHDRLRQLAVQGDIDAGQFDRAEQLCLVKTKEESSHPYGRPSQWQYMLRDIYQKSGQQDKLTAQLRQLVLSGDLNSFDDLKSHLQQAGTWDEAYPGLLQDIASHRSPQDYMYILSKEGETDLLMAQIRLEPGCVFTYGKQLARQYPDEVYGLCAARIRNDGKQASTRRDYQKVCSLLAQLASFGGVLQAQALIAELRAAYPRRSALLDELNKTERRLMQNTR